MFAHEMYQNCETIKLYKSTFYLNKNCVLLSLDVFENDLVSLSHRYTRNIPEPVPFLSRHGIPIGGLLIFPYKSK